jgi:sugar fermentation stimulation protein A
MSKQPISVPACSRLCRALRAASLPPGGTYTILLWLPTARSITIGRLGYQHFPRGYYTYTGSARRGLVARLHRHLHGAMTRHWHIDYLRPHVWVLDWRVYPGDSQPECHLNSQLARHGCVVVPRFGASDCACLSHLLHYPGQRRPPWRVDIAACT